MPVENFSRLIFMGRIPQEQGREDNYSVMVNWQSSLPSHSAIS
jgi:hypothetical protein